jgi:phosphoketolase
MQSLMSQNWTDLWRLGYGPLLRDPITVHRVDDMASQLTKPRVWPDNESIYRVLAAADRLTSAAMWLVLHMGYARRVDVTGAPLRARDFKDEPVGRVADALQVVPAFIGYLTANVLSGRTRSWVMDSGCCGVAIEAVNTLTGDVSYGPKGRYNNTQAGLSRLVADCSSRAFATDGRPSAAVGGSAGADTAGAGSEGGETESPTDLQYVHMPLRGESLVAFLGDDASDGQRALDGSPLRWRAEDCGLVTPIMILNADGPGAGSAVAGSSKAACLDGRLRTCVSGAVSPPSRPDPKR